MSASDAATSWVGKLAGRFIVFDGPDGSGKSTQFHRFADYLARAGVAVCEVREPGGTAVGEAIRNILLDTAHDDMDLRCEMLLYMASRAQLVAHRIAPARAAGQCVLADRFIPSTLAYQGAAGGIAEADILHVGRIAVGAHWPDLVVVFDVDQATAASRLSPLLDRMEQKGAAFHRTVRQGYLDQARRDPQRYIVIDATADPDTVFERLVDALKAKDIEGD